MIFPRDEGVEEEDEKEPREPQFLKDGQRERKTEEETEH